MPGESNGWSRLVGYSPWSHKKSDTTEQLHFTHFILYYWRRKWQPTPVFLPGESHGQGSLVGCSPWCHKELYTTKQLHFTHFILYHWRRKWQPTLVFLPGEPYGQRSLAGHGPWSHRESYRAERLRMQGVIEYSHFIFTCSCLVLPAPFTEEIVFYPLYVVASFVIG